MNRADFVAPSSKSILFGPQIKPDYSWLDQYINGDNQPSNFDKRNLNMNANGQMNFPGMSAPGFTVKFDELKGAKAKYEPNKFFFESATTELDNKKQMSDNKKQNGDNKGPSNSQNFGGQYFAQQAQASQFYPQRPFFIPNSFVPQQTGKLNTIQTTWTLVGPQGVQGTSTGSSLVGDAM